MNILFNSNLLKYREPKIKGLNLFYSVRCKLDTYNVPRSISITPYSEKEYEKELFKLKAIIDYANDHNDYLVIDYDNNQFQIFENGQFSFTDELPEKSYVEYSMIKSLIQNEEVSTVNRYFELNEIQKNI